MKRNRILSVAMIFAAAVVCSLPVSAQKVGTSSLQFLKVMPTARATAMGDAYSTLASGADAAFWNPAGLTTATGIEVSGTHILWMFDTRQSTLAASLPMGSWGTVGVNLQYVDYGSINVTTPDRLVFVGSGADYHYNPGLTGETYSPSSYVIGLSYAQKMTDKFSAGITAKYINESLWNSSTVMVVNKATGAVEKVNTYAHLFLFDFGMQYNTGYRSVRIGVAIQNFGQQVTFAKESFPAPLMFRIGTAADLIGPDGLFGSSASNRITFAYDLFQPNDYSQQMHIGTEYSFEEAFFVRAGYKVFYDNDNLTVGAGIRQYITGLPFTFDYSYGAMGDYLPSVHRLSLGVQFQ
ncbi:MAG: PorV/PorQ family protein [Bacteroidota bacterium]